MEIRKELYAGSIKIFKSVRSAKKLSQHFQEHILPNHSLLSRKGSNHTNTQEEVRASACKDFENDPVTSILWKEIIEEVKIHTSPVEYNLSTSAPLSNFAWDRVRLRIQQSGAGYDDITKSLHSFGRYSSTLPLHRDTWASLVMQQLNWWTPLLDIDENRTLAIYPSYFAKELPNTTNSWSLSTLKEKRRAKIPYPQLPQLSMEKISKAELESIEHDKQPIVIRPGDVMVFSGQHLHGSVINNTGLTRFSSEIRTVDIHDVKHNIGAKNIDGYMHGCHLEWFHAIEEEVIEDGSAVPRLKKGMNLKKIVKSF